jgi:hypothetical protein
MVEGVNRYGPVLDPDYVQRTLEGIDYVDDLPDSANPHFEPPVPPKDRGTLHVASSPSDAHLFHELVHAIEHRQGDPDRGADWNERNAYWVENHLTEYIPRLQEIEGFASRGQGAEAYRRFEILRQKWQQGASAANQTYSTPDNTGMQILRNAGYRFDLEQARQMIEQRTGVDLT